MFLNFKVIIVITFADGSRFIDLTFNLISAGKPRGFLSG